MKKSFLLVVAGLAISVANAQESKSVVFTKTATLPEGYKSAARQVTIPSSMTNRAAAKSTGTTSGQGAWFSYQDAFTQQGVTSGPIAWPIYNDTSLLLKPTTGSPFNWYIQGLGTSFDPTSTVFSAAGYRNDPTMSMYPMPPFAVGAKDSFDVDSITVLGYYGRTSYNNYTDTLNIYIAAIPGTGTAAFTYNSSTFFTDTLGVPDGKFHVATLQYDSASNSILSSEVPGVIKIQKVLDAAAFADSVGAGTHLFTLAIPGKLKVAANGKIAAYQQFVSGHNYGFDHLLDSTNTWNVAAYELNGQGVFPTQAQNDYNTGLIMTGQSRYDMNNQGFVYQNAQYILSTYFYLASGFDDPFFAFHIHCTTCWPESVNNVEKVISNVTAYPSPASSEVYIPFTLSKSSSVTVTVANTLGQVVGTQNFSNVTSGKASFNTSVLASGVYFYTVQANGETSTGRFAVSH